MIAGARNGLALLNEECDPPNSGIPPDSCAESGGAFRFSGQLAGEQPLQISGAVIFSRPDEDGNEWYGSLPELQSYTQLGQQAVSDCLKDGSLPVNLSLIGECIREEFTEQNRPAPRVVSVLAGDDDNDDHLPVFWAPEGAIIYASPVLRIPLGSGSTEDIAFLVAMLPPKNL